MRSRRPSRTTPRPSSSIPIPCQRLHLPRGRLREYLNDPKVGAKSDRAIAQRKIAEYRSRLSDSTYSIYADTTQRFDRLLSFDSKFAGGSFDRITGHNGGREEMRLLPLFKFTLMRPLDSLPESGPTRLQRIEDFQEAHRKRSTSPSRAAKANIAPDTLRCSTSEYALRSRARHVVDIRSLPNAASPSRHQTVHHSVNTLFVSHRDPQTFGTRSST